MLLRQWYLGGFLFFLLNPLSFSFSHSQNQTKNKQKSKMNQNKNKKIGNKTPSDLLHLLNHPPALRALIDEALKDYEEHIKEEKKE